MRGYTFVILEGKHKSYSLPSSNEVHASTCGLKLVCGAIHFDSKLCAIEHLCRPRRGLLNALYILGQRAIESGHYGSYHEMWGGSWMQPHLCAVWGSHGHQREPHWSRVFMKPCWLFHSSSEQTFIANLTATVAYYHTIRSITFVPWILDGGTKTCICQNLVHLQRSWTPLWHLLVKVSPGSLVCTALEQFKTLRK